MSVSSSQSIQKQHVREFYVLYERMRNDGSALLGCEECSSERQMCIGSVGLPTELKIKWLLYWICRIQTKKKKFLGIPDRQCILHGSTTRVSSSELLPRIFSAIWPKYSNLSISDLECMCMYIVCIHNKYKGNNR